ncbi:MAG: hypothetical protein JW839_22790 [Candidatus Lokiarchaeota archaeon]|nr:hypothetical protein [Candidatus Lokiarchaeota archaeon]
MDIVTGSRAKPPGRVPGPTAGSRWHDFRGVQILCWKSRDELHATLAGRGAAGFL